MTTANEPDVAGKPGAIESHEARDRAEAQAFDFVSYWGPGEVERAISEGEELLDRMIAARTEGEEAWEALRAETYPLAEHGYDRAFDAILWLLGFLEGLERVRPVTHRAPPRVQ